MMIDQLATRKETVDAYISKSFADFDCSQQRGVQKLKESMGYSLLQGGKRFRPVLCLLIAEAFGVGPQRVLPWAMAVEMVHAYSLIHDDLPCMDDDDERRGRPTNHKVYGEATALLAGDTLLTEAFRLLSQAFVQEPQIGLRLVSALSEAAGLRGMVGGQAIDLEAQASEIGIHELDLMHSLKTGALIRVCAEGTGIACGLPPEKVELCRQFGAHLGLAFQLKDDLLDSSEENLEPGSFPGMLGLEKTRQYLQAVMDQAFETLSKLEISNGLLHELVQFNQNRKS